ncbi:PREDICTED: S-antigen protein-like [Camelina sativa]|uniref:S-antigen protein-like n=1 Tax=Camelina sativa TaxID=90675 RepID=A0ABM1QZT1_CAMSA|nr:PREDICTED: S-antigen protein-like [Camelina sativa]
MNESGKRKGGKHKSVERECNEREGVEREGSERESISERIGTDELSVSEVGFPTNETLARHVEIGAEIDVSRESEIDSRDPRAGFTDEGGELSRDGLSGELGGKRHISSRGSDEVADRQFAVAAGLRGDELGIREIEVDEEGLGVGTDELGGGEVGGRRAEFVSSSSARSKVASGSSLGVGSGIAIGSREVGICRVRIVRSARSDDVDADHGILIASEDDGGFNDGNADLMMGGRPKARSGNVVDERNVKVGLVRIEGWCDEVGIDELGNRSDELGNGDEVGIDEPGNDEISNGELCIAIADLFGRRSMSWSSMCLPMPIWG